jgi:DNA processing protein
MPVDAELASWVALTQIPGLGGEGLRRLLQAFGSPETVFAASPLALREHVKPAVAERIAQGPDPDGMETLAAWLKSEGNRIITLADADYPRSLLNIPDPPPLLYAKGDLALLDRPALAVVGSRNATAQGIGHAEAFSEAISAAGLCIVSGMAHGIDSAAHWGGLRGTGGSIAVVGTGLDRVYPAVNRDLAHELAAHGLLLSEFSLGTPPLAANFPRRNRIISGLALGCLVVEASLQSGSLITARMALEQGREVFAIPGSIHSPQSRGCHSLIKQGAKLVETALDVLDELGPVVPSMSPAATAARGTKASAPGEPPHPLLAHLGFDPLSMDVLSARSGLTIEALSAILLQLELEGHVASQPGGLYQRTH